MTLWTGALDLLFPAKCPFCQSILDEPRAILCPDCQTTLPWLLGREGETGVDFAAGCVSPLAYRDRVSAAVRRFKFSRVRSYGAPFGTLMAQCVQDHLPEPVDALTWAPLSRKRMRERGFDQSELLARAVGEGLSLPVLPTLEKVRHTGPQSDLTEASARRANALGAYRLRPEADVRGKRLLLVDDVVTSGATLSECTRVLLEGGAEKVWCVTLARASGGNNGPSEGEN